LGKLLGYLLFLDQDGALGTVNRRQDEGNDDAQKKNG